MSWGIGELPASRAMTDGDGALVSTVGLPLPEQSTSKLHYHRLRQNPSVVSGTDRCYVFAGIELSFKFRAVEGALLAAARLALSCWTMQGDDEGLAHAEAL